MLAGLAAVAASGTAGHHKADGSPFFAHMNLEHLSGASGPGGVAFPGAHAGGDNQADPDATPMPIKEEVGGLRFMDRGTGKCLQRFGDEGVFKNETYRVRSTLAMGDAYVVSGSEDGRGLVWDGL